MHHARLEVAHTGLNPYEFLSSCDFFSGSKPGRPPWKRYTFHAAGITEMSRLLAAAFLRLFKSVEEAPGVGAGECVEPVRLSFLDGVARDGALRAQEFGFFLHLAVPHVFVQFADVHEHAHL